jgi:Helicase conserved C-terminal domain
LIIGTVDKFAMLPWNTEARRLFGLADKEPVPPPELIIQDELHLISGALGSMVGLYESTIDALCQHEVSGVRRPAKIVASTATICRASDQVHSLYARNVFLFPPQGLRAGDSFFAEEKTQAPGRLYVGVFGAALSSHVTAQVRVMAALLQAVNSVSTTTATSIDPYWTLVAYFNSLRELGHAATLIRADIREHLNAVWDRLDIRKPKDGSQSLDRRRFIDRDMELTSRIQSSQVTEVLQRLFEPCRDDFDGKGRRNQSAVDVCLATNMIQVGLDVPRLGLITVVGQPKTTSEYIQATSRVGRTEKGPGLVVTIYNPAKPRDRSHYEHFHSYHQSIYRWVEPTSVTPFAVPVRDRALHAQFVTLARYWGNQDTRESPNPPPDNQLIYRIREILTERIREIDYDEGDQAEQMMDDFIRHWMRILPRIYGHFGPPPLDTPLMYPSGTEPRQIWAGRSKATPSSMRNVDAGCNAKVILQFPQL